MNSDGIKVLIGSFNEDAVVNVSSDDNVSFRSNSYFSRISGKSLVQRHQMVYRSLGD